MKLKKIIKLLNDAPNDDIWYDAEMYQDKRTAKRIAKVQRAMCAAVELLQEDLDFEEALNSAPITLVYGDGHEEEVHLDKVLPQTTTPTLTGCGPVRDMPKEPRSAVEEAVTEWFGPRCPDFEPGCSACDAWAEYDQLVGRHG